MPLDRPPARLLLAALVATTTLATAQAATRDATVVRTELGEARGLRRADGSLVWYNLPYAAPPVGDAPAARPRRRVFRPPACGCQR